MIKNQKKIKKREQKNKGKLVAKNLHQLHPTVKGLLFMEKYFKKLIDRLEVENLRLQNTNDRLRREADKLKRENAKLRSAVADLAGDRVNVCKVLGERVKESEGRQ